jgi:hypothetical protein
MSCKDMNYKDMNYEYVSGCLIQSKCIPSRLSFLESQGVDPDGYLPAISVLKDKHKELTLVRKRGKFEMNIYAIDGGFKEYKFVACISSNEYNIEYLIWVESFDCVLRFVSEISDYIQLASWDGVHALLDNAYNLDKKNSRFSWLTRCRK